MEGQVIIAFGAGVAVSGVIFFFVWRNNKKWFLDAETKVNELIADAQSGKLTADIKAKLEALLAEIRAKK